MEVTRVGHVGTEDQPSLALNSHYSIASQAYLHTIGEISAPVFRRMQFFCFKCSSYGPFHIEGWTTIWISFENLFNMKPLTRFTFWSQILLKWEQLQRDGSDSSNSLGFRPWRSLPGSDCATNCIQVVACRIFFQNSDSNHGKNSAIDSRKSLHQYHYGWYEVI